MHPTYMNRYMYVYMHGMAEVFAILVRPWILLLGSPDINFETGFLTGLELA